MQALRKGGGSPKTQKREFWTTPAWGIFTRELENIRAEVDAQRLESSRKNGTTSCPMHMDAPLCHDAFMGRSCAHLLFKYSRLR